MIGLSKYFISGYLLVSSITSMITTNAIADPQWPEQPIKFIVSQPAGAGPDIAARMVGNNVSENLGRPVIV